MRRSLDRIRTAAYLSHGACLRLSFSGSCTACGVEAGVATSCAVSGDTRCSWGKWSGGWGMVAAVEVVVAIVKLEDGVIVVFAFVVEVEQFGWDLVEGFGADRVDAVSAFQVPETIVAGAFDVVEVLVGVVFQ